MKLYFLSFLFLSLVIGCSKKQEPIMLVCEGVETTSGYSEGKTLQPESVKVKRTFKFTQDNRTVKSGNFDFRNPQENYKEEKKLVWVFSIDNSPEKFEEDTYTFSKGRTEFRRVYVSVSDTEMYESERRDVEYDDKKDSSYDDYQVTINRISGDFRENQIQTYKGTGGSFRIVTVGNCKKVDKKF